MTTIEVLGVIGLVSIVLSFIRKNAKHKREVELEKIKYQKEILALEVEKQKNEILLLEQESKKYDDIINNS